jgi:hypothetical protein
MTMTDNTTNQSYATWHAWRILKSPPRYAVSLSDMSTTNL